MAEQVVQEAPSAPLPAPRPRPSNCGADRTGERLPPGLKRRLAEAAEAGGGVEEAVRAVEETLLAGLRVSEQGVSRPGHPGGRSLLPGRRRRDLRPAGRIDRPRAAGPQRAFPPPACPRGGLGALSRRQLPPVTCRLASPYRLAALRRQVCLRLLTPISISSQGARYVRIHFGKRARICRAGRGGRDQRLVGRAARAGPGRDAEDHDREPRGR